MTPPFVQPYLFFGGTCAAALDYYAKHLRAEIIMKMCYDDSPEPHPAGMVPKGWGDKIMHATFRIGTSTLMGSDGCDESPGKNSHCMSLTMPNAAEAMSAFTALAAGGSIGMPLGKTFWSPCFGMVTDAFGIHWMVTVPEQSEHSLK
jgi:PhnB protein